MTDPRTIAAGLTEAQKRMVLIAAYYRSEELRCFGRDNTKAALRRRGLMNELYLTPLGLAVRAILQEQPHAK